MLEMNYENQFNKEIMITRIQQIQITYVPGIGTGLEEGLWNLGDPPWGFFGEELLDVRRGVSGGVAPLPFARLSPIAFTNSFTDTPTNSEKSLKIINNMLRWILVY